MHRRYQHPRRREKQLNTGNSRRNSTRASPLELRNNVSQFSSGSACVRVVHPLRSQASLAGSEESRTLSLARRLLHLAMHRRGKWSPSSSPSLSPTVRPVVCSTAESWNTPDRGVWLTTVQRVLDEDATNVRDEVVSPQVTSCGNEKRRRITTQ